MLKPNDEYGGKGIVLGWTVDQTEWEQALHTATLEPYALDLWRHELAHWLPPELAVSAMTKRTFFGGLYQLLTLTRGDNPDPTAYASVIPESA